MPISHGRDYCHSALWVDRTNISPEPVILHSTPHLVYSFQEYFNLQKSKRKKEVEFLEVFIQWQFA